MFIPHEVKEKIGNLEQEVKKLKAENLDLKNSDRQPKKSSSPVAPILLGVLLILSVILNVYFFTFANTTEAVDEQARIDSVSFYLDGEIVKMSTEPIEGVVYRVQIGAYQEYNLEDYAPNLDALHEDASEGFTKISLGGFSDILKAQAFQQEAARMGLDRAYIVAFKDEVPVGVLPPKEKKLNNDTIN